EVAEVAGVEGVTARTGCALVLAPERERQRVDAVHFLRVLHGQRRHTAVADRRGLAIERLGDADARLVRRYGPGDEALALHEALGAERAEQRVVELGRARDVVRSERNV